MAAIYYLFFHITEQMPDPNGIVGLLAFDDWMAAFTSMATIVLSGALVYLYFQQKNLLQQQYQLMKANVRPILQIQGPFPTRYNETEGVEFSMKNVGLGKALNIRFRWNLLVHDEYGERPVEKYLTEEGDGVVVSPENRELWTQENDDLEVRGTRGDVLAPQERAEFNVPVTVRVERDGSVTRDLPFHDGLRHVVEVSGYDRIAFHMVIEYESIEGTEFVEALIDEDLQGDEPRRLEEIIARD